MKRTSKKEIKRILKRNTKININEYKINEALFKVVSLIDYDVINLNNDFIFSLKLLGGR